MKTFFQQFISVFFSISLLYSCTRQDVSSTNGFKGNITRNVVYATNTNYAGQSENLDLDIYLPHQATAGTKYPLILYIHGGGFHVGDKESSQGFCQLLSQKGFVVATINYRLGWMQNETNACDGDTTEAIEAIYRAIQDANAALRFLAANANSYSIDTNWIFVGGASAGAVTSLGVVYYSQNTIDHYFPWLSSKLGLLNNSGNTLQNTYTIKGIASMWGSLYHSDLITENNATPTIFFHGEKDMVIPFDIDHFYTCSNYPMGYGTKPLYTLLTSFGVPAVAHVDPEGGHGVFTEQFRADNIICFFNSLMPKQTPETGFYIGEKYSCN